MGVADDEVTGLRPARAQVYACALQLLTWGRIRQKGRTLTARRSAALTRRCAPGWGSDRPAGLGAGLLRWTVPLTLWCALIFRRKSTESTLKPQPRPEGLGDGSRYFVKSALNGGCTPHVCSRDVQGLQGKEPRDSREILM